MLRVAAAVACCLAFVGVSTEGLRAQGADPSLVAAAKAEGSLTWYTTQIVNQFARPAAEAFEKKYGVRVNYVRADPAEIVLRISAEAKAGRTQADVYDGTATAPGLKKQGLAMQWLPSSAKRLGRSLVDKEGYWTATNLYVLTPGYNTDLVKAEDRPKTLDDLLDPRWKGRMVWSRRPASSAGPGFVGLVLADRGEEKGMAYLKKLAGQNITGVDAAARQVLDQVIAGEYPLALMIFNHHTRISAAKGAPVDWAPMNPAMAVLSVVGLTKDAPHPNAGKLFVEFLTSPEGQAFFRDANYIPVDPDVKIKDETLRPDGKRLRAVYMTPEQIDSAMPRWAETFDKLFR